MRILALDPSFAATGWAVGSPDGIAPSWGTIPPCAGPIRLQLRRFAGQVQSLVSKYHPALIVYEFDEVIAGPGGGGAKTNRSEGSRFRLQAAIELTAIWSGIETLSAPVSTWRKSFIGLARAPKIGVLRGTGRQWLKTRTVEECKRMGWNVRNDNEADALGILVHALSLKSPEYAARMAGPLTRYPRSAA